MSGSEGTRGRLLVLADHCLGEDPLARLLRKKFPRELSTELLRVAISQPTPISFSPNAHTMAGDEIKGKKRKSKLYL
jgi:hypothetical protein